MWFLCFCQPQKEYVAVERIRQQGFGPYLPEVVEKGKRKPLFPRYLFVETDGRWRFLNGTGGISYTVMNGADPAQVPMMLIDELRLRETNGVIELPRKTFVINQQLRLKSGPLKDHLVLWQGQSTKDRQRVLLELLGRQMPIEVLTNDLEEL